MTLNNYAQSRNLWIGFMIFKTKTFSLNNVKFVYTGRIYLIKDGNDFGLISL